MNELRERLTIELSRQIPTSSTTNNPTTSASATNIDTKSQNLKKGQNSIVTVKKSEESGVDSVEKKSDETKSLIKSSSELLFTNKTLKSAPLPQSSKIQTSEKMTSNYSVLKSQIETTNRRLSQSQPQSSQQLQKKVENKLYYSLDCEVENGHDNPGEQRLITSSKNTLEAKNVEASKTTGKEVK